VRVAINSDKSDKRIQEMRGLVRAENKAPNAPNAQMLKDSV
jgi:hypothetical protein